MLIRDGKEYSSMFLNSREYTSLFRGGKEYGFATSFRPRTQDVIDYATLNGYTLPTDLNAYNTLIGELEDSGVLDKLDLFYCFFGDSDADFKTINIIDVTKFKGTVGTTTENSLDGLKGSGTSTGVINTNNVLDTFTGNYQYTNACRGYFLSSKAGVISEATGTIDGLGVGLFRQCMSIFATTRQRINSDRNNLSASANILNDATFGVVTLSRTSGSNVNIVVVGSGTANFTQTIAEFSGYPQIIFRNSSYYGIPKLGAYFTGASLNETEATYIDTALKNYYNTLTS